MVAGLILVMVAIASPANGRPLPDLREARRIVFLGDSITYAGHYVAWVEGWLAVAAPSEERMVLNLGLPSETVSGLSEEGHAGGRFPRPDLHERLERVLAATKPDLVVACYGVNCGIYQSFDPSRFQAYQDGIRRLRAAVHRSGAEIIHLTPWPYDHGARKLATLDYNEGVLGRYSAWLLAQRESGWHVIDLHGPMTAEITARRRISPGFTFQRDGVHPDAAGHWFGAQQVIQAMGDEKAAKASNAGEMMDAYHAGREVLPLVEERMGILRDAWLSETKHKRPGVRAGLPLAEAQEKASALAARIRQVQENGKVDPAGRPVPSKR